MNNKGNNLGVSLADYQTGRFDNQTLFDNAHTSPEALAELSKALEALEITGRDTANSTTDSGAPLKVESLEKNLKVLTFKESDIVMWRRIPKMPAFNTVEEFNQLQSYGADRGGFNNEGELPVEEDSVYVRRSQLVKFLGVTKSVTHPMTLVNTNVGDIMQREITNGTMWILRKANRALAYGDDRFIPQEFNGLYSQHERNDAFSTLSDYMESSSVIDCRGKNLREANIENAAEGIIENHGFGDLMIAPPKVLTDFVKNFYGNKFIPVNGSGITDGKMGQRVRSFASQYGDIELIYDKFLNQAPPRKPAAAASSSLAPAAVTSASAALVSDTGNKFTGFTGDYYFGIAAVNRYGESSLVATNVVVLTVTSGNSVDLTFTDGGGANPATAYVIYMSKKNPTTAYADTLLYPVFTVSTSQKSAGFDGAAAGKVRIRNRYLPATNQAFLIEDSPEIYSFKQLAPLMKMDLALLGPAMRFMILLYGTPMLYAPLKMTRFINIGEDLT